MKLPIKFNIIAYTEMFLGWYWYKYAPEKYHQFMDDLPPHTGSDRTNDVERISHHIKWGKQGGLFANLTFEPDGYLHFRIYGIRAMKGNEEYALGKVAEWVVQVLSVLTRYGLIEEETV